MSASLPLSGAANECPEADSLKVYEGSLAAISAVPGSGRRIPSVPKGRSSKGIQHDRRRIFGESAGGRLGVVNPNL